ncbi:MAG: hypothetical protein KDC44_10195, partial [Phaeodactylibacter sp.]|nr:hypothetical protein [Phaeodactylibacter sp.]
EGDAQLRFQQEYDDTASPKKTVKEMRYTKGNLKSTRILQYDGERLLQKEYYEADGRLRITDTYTYELNNAAHWIEKKWYRNAQLRELTRRNIQYFK